MLKLECPVHTEEVNIATRTVIRQKGRWQAQALGLRIDDFLARNDSYHFLQQTGDLIMTGPTGTNVMDMTALLIS